LINSVGADMFDNQEKYSKNIDESKKNNFFLGYYLPLEDSIFLGELSIKTEKIWYEKNWTTDHDFLFRKKIKINEGIHLVVPITSLSDGSLNFAVFIQHKSPTCQDCFLSLMNVDRLGYVHTINSAPDTLIFQFATENGFGHKDTIKYIKE